VARAAGKTLAGKRGRGRPARLSRDAILEAGLALLDRAPDEALTLSRVAEEVGAVPAALYRHVGSHDELIDGVLGLVLQGIRFEIRARAGWAGQVRDWMTCVRTHLLRHPAALSLIGRRGHTSPAWFDATSVLLEILERAGLRGDALARSYLWAAEVTMGAIVTHASVPLAEQLAAARRALPEMSDEARRRHAPLISHLSAIDAEKFFALVAEGTIAGLADLVEGRTAKPGR
jgi:AcrR family transcriptional regulator